MLRLFRSNHPSIYLLLLLWALLLRLGYLLFPQKGVAWQTVAGLDFLSSEYILLLQVVAVLVIVVEAVVVNFVLVRFDIVEQNTTIPALLFVTLGAIFPATASFSIPLLVLLPLLLTLNQFYRLQQPGAMHEPLLYVGMLIGLCTLFYPFSVVFLIAGVLAVMVFRTGSWREYGLIVTGFLLPPFFVFIWYFWKEAWPQYVQQLTEPYYLNIHIPEFTGLEWAVLGYVGMLMLLGRAQIRGSSGTFTIRLQRYYRHLFLMLLALLVPLFIWPTLPEVYLLLLFYPATVYLTLIFDRPRPHWMRKLMFWLLVLAAFYQQWKWVQKAMAGA